MKRFFDENINAVFFSLFLLAGLAYLDFVTGYDLGFFVFYFIPISIIGWFAGRPLAIITAFLAAAVWLLVDRYSGHPYSNWSYPYWNAFVRWTSFVILAIAISQIKLMLEKEKRLKLDLAKALEKINRYISAAKKVADGDLTATEPSFNKTDQLGETFSFMIERLTEQKSLEKRLFELERQAIIAESASHMAHEIRNPLNLIMLTAHHIGTQFIPSDESKKLKFNDLISSLKSEVEQLSNVVSNFMAMGKPTELKKLNIPLFSIINQIHILVKQQLISKNIFLEFTGTDGVMMLADPERMKLVFLNLIVNSIAAVAENGRITITADWHSVLRKITIIISDSGTGIKTEDFERIFEPYFTRKSDGTGLGLSLVKRIIEEHCGRITASNNNTGGARFEISLPQEEQLVNKSADC